MFVPELEGLWTPSADDDEAATPNRLQAVFPVTSINLSYRKLFRFPKNLFSFFSFFTKSIFQVKSLSLVTLPPGQVEARRYHGGHPNVEDVTEARGGEDKGA